MNPNRFYTYKGKERELQSFLAAYFADKFLTPPEQAMRKLNSPTSRICRFCKGSSPETNFREDAHIIPQFLGNKYLISEFECDNCNSLFGTYDNDLANWIGITRSVAGTQGKTGIPTFKSPGERLTARHVEFFNEKATRISTPVPDRETIDINPQTGITTINYKKLPYTPIKVYKALLKMALSAVPSEEAEDYRSAFNFLIEQGENHNFQVFARVMVNVQPATRFAVPFGVLFTKKDPEAKLPKHVFVLHYESHLYAFPLPFNRTDISAGHYRDFDMNILYPPPVLANRPCETEITRDKLIDFSGNDIVKNEEAAMSLHASPELFNNLAGVDLKTGEAREGQLDPNEILGIYLTSENLVIPIKRTN